MDSSRAQQSAAGFRRNEIDCHNFYAACPDAYIKKLEADADWRTVDVARGQVALKREEFELSKARAEYVVDLVSRAGDSETQKILQKRLQRAIYELASGDDDESETRAKRETSFGWKAQQEKNMIGGLAVDTGEVPLN